jgi:hypothetical protein
MRGPKVEGKKKAIIKRKTYFAATALILKYK